MKRFSPEHIKKTACEFASSRMADSWYFFGEDIHKAMIDSWVMTEIQWAEVADSTRTFTPREIIDFRNAVIAKLAEGVVAANTRRPKRAFKMES